MNEAAAELTMNQAEMNGRSRGKTVRRIIRTADRIVNMVLGLAFILLILIGLYFIKDTIDVYNNAGAARMAAYKPEVITTVTLKEISENAVAWIQIADTDIDYPVMQGSNNMEYLNKAPDGSYAISGSIFLDSRNNAGFTDNYSIVYGHHMSGGYMFGALDEFGKEDFFLNHREGTLKAGDTEYRFTTAAFLICDASDEEIFDPFSEGKVEFIRTNAVYIDESLLGERLVALTTCKEPGSTTRTILVGVLRPMTEE